MGKVLFLLFLATTILAVVYSVAHFSKAKSNSVHPPKADTSKCKYDREIQRRTALAPRPPVDLTNLPPKNPKVLAAFQGVNRDRVVENLRKFTGELPVTITRDGKQVTGTIVTRSSYSKELYDLALPWVEQEFQALGLTTHRHVYSKGMYNLVATIKGDGTSKKRIVYSAHGDATAGETWRNERKTTGADDDASGVILLLEVARAMKDQHPKYDIDFVVFTMEEQGLEGSAAYFDKIKAEGVQLLTMIQYDMVGYHGTEGNRMDVHDSENEKGTHAYYEVAAREAAVYEEEIGVKPYDTHNKEMRRRSDHSSALDCDYAGFMMSEEFTDAAFNPYYHSLQDTVDKLNIPYYEGVVKLAIAVAYNLSEIK